MPPAPDTDPSWDDVLDAGAEAGTAVSEALVPERAGRAAGEPVSLVTRDRAQAEAAGSLGLTLV